MSRLYLFPLCSVTKTVWSSVRLETHVDKVPARNAAKRVWLCVVEAGYRTCAQANDCPRACDQVCGIQTVSSRCRTFVSRALSPS